MTTPPAPAPPAADADASRAAELRRQFLLDEGLAFLNHGSFGAVPQPVFDAWQRWQRTMERNPVAFLGRDSGALLSEAGAAWAAALGVPADELAFVPNATAGVNIVARSLPLQPGDEVLATDHEYGACDATWQFACAQRGAVYRRIEIPLPFDPDTFVARLMAAVTPRTRVVFASHLTSTTALAFPVAALCTAARERGLLSVIDAAHAPGHWPLDSARPGALDVGAIGADFTTGNGHKWLCAPKGVAFLHARREHHALLQPPVVSWGYVAGADGVAEDAPPGLFDRTCGRSALQRRLLWQGTRDLSAALTVPAALDWHARHLGPAVRQRCHALALQTMRRVTARNGLAPIAPDRCFGQMVPIPVRLPPGLDGEGLRARLLHGFGIEVPVTWHAGQAFVRVSVQGYTAPAELDRLVDALAALGV